MGEDLTISIYGKTYSVVAVEFEDEDGETRFWANICEVAADGGPGRSIIDECDPAETYTTSRECLQRAMAHVI